MRTRHRNIHRACIDLALAIIDHTVPLVLVVNAIRENLFSAELLLLIEGVDRRQVVTV